LVAGFIGFNIPVLTAYLPSQTVWGFNGLILAMPVCKNGADAARFFAYLPPQHFLNFRPLPQGQGSLRPAF